MKSMLSETRIPGREILYSGVFRKFLYLSGILLLCGIISPSHGIAQEKCPGTLPKDVLIIPPDTDVPPKFAVFSGIWQGDWSPRQCVSLAVELVESDGFVRYIYGWGKTQWKPPGYSTGSSKIVDGTFYLDSSIAIIFTINEDGTLSGEYRKDYSLWATLVKQN